MEEIRNLVNKTLAVLAVLRSHNIEFFFHFFWQFGLCKYIEHLYFYCSICFVMCDESHSSILWNSVTLKSLEKNEKSTEKFHS